MTTNNNISALGQDEPPAGGCMMPKSKSQTCLEAVRLMTIICTMTTITIGTLNLCTMYETGNIAQVTAEIKNYNLSIIGISES